MGGANTEIVERAFASTRTVLANVRPDQLTGPTPCNSWDVRALVNHIVRGGSSFAAIVNGDARPEAIDYADGDIVASFDEGAAQAVRAFAAPGALDAMVSVPFGTIPCSVFIGIASIDAFSHGWDLARATGQSTDLDADLAERLLERARANLPPSFRGPDGSAPFGPEVTPPADATPADRLAAFLGRTV